MGKFFNIRPARRLSAGTLGGEEKPSMSTELSTWFPNSLAYWLFIIIFIVWAASEVINTFWFRHYQNKRNIRADRGSYWIIWLIIWISFILSLILRANNLGVFNNYIQFIGLLISILGIILREWAVLTLGRSYTVIISIDTSQKLVKHGPYHWLRHPSYTGSILSLVGFSLALGTWLGGVIVLFLSLAGYFYRAIIEEKVLLEAFGEEYQDYMKHTWRLFPGF
jgi:protein-S-isoprenylcysteine O-methyltransferase Ste14